MSPTTALTQLPTPEALAGMVTNVTETMFGMKFALEQAPPSGPANHWRAATLPIPGKRPITVAIAADDRACSALASAMFGCKPEQVDVGMINDSLREMANIVGGQVKSALHLDQALGLPRIIEQDRPWSPAERWRSATLSRGATQTVVWVAVAEQLL